MDGQMDGRMNGWMDEWLGRTLTHKIYICFWIDGDVDRWMGEKKVKKCTYESG